MFGKHVRLRDLDFDWRYIWGRDYGGNLSWIWSRIGMPRIKRNMELCAFYLYRQNPHPAGGIEGPGATGFFVARKSDKLAWLYHVYAVSNAHNINQGWSFIRVNTKDGATRFINIPADDWATSSTVDLSVVDVTDLLSLNPGSASWSDDISWIDEQHFLTREFIQASDVGIGDNTLMLGMFADHYGGSKNLPVGRFGNIASLPHDSAPVRLSAADRFVCPSYLNDTRSRGGFSGSPVWVYRTTSDDLTHLPFDTLQAEGFSIGAHESPHLN